MPTATQSKGEVLLGSDRGYEEDQERGGGGRAPAAEGGGGGRRRREELAASVASGSNPPERHHDNGGVNRNEVGSSMTVTAEDQGGSGTKAGKDTCSYSGDHVGPGDAAAVSSSSSSSATPPVEKPPLMKNNEGKAPKGGSHRLPLLNFRPRLQPPAANRRLPKQLRDGKVASSGRSVTSLVEGSSSGGTTDGMIRTVATANDIGEVSDDSKDDRHDDTAATGLVEATGHHPNSTRPNNNNNNNNQPQPVRLVRSLTSSLARYHRSSMSMQQQHTVTFSPSEESVLVVRPIPPLGLAMPGDSTNALDNATSSTDYSTGGLSMPTTSSELTSGASDSTMSSHFVVTTTVENEEMQEVEVVAVVVGDAAGEMTTSALSPSEAISPSPPPRVAQSTNSREPYVLDLGLDDEPMLAVANRTVMLTATTPKGESIELVGPTDSDIELANEYDNLVMISSSDSNSIICRGGTNSPSAAGPVEFKQTVDAHPPGCGSNSATGLAAWDMNPCPGTVPPPPGLAGVESRDENCVPAPWSSYPWSLFQPQATIGGLDDDGTPTDADPNEPGEDSTVRAEARFVKLVNDTAAIVHGTETSLGVGPCFGLMNNPTTGLHDAIVPTPKDSKPLTEGQSRVLAELYARTSASGSVKEPTENDKPWEGTATGAGPKCAAAKTTNADGSSSPPTGRGRSNGLIRLGRRYRVKQKGLVVAHNKSDAAPAPTKDVTAQIQEVTSLESESQFSLPKNLLQFDFVLSSDLSSSYYGSSGAETRSTVLSSQDVHSKESRNESTTSVDDSAMKRSSCDSSDRSGSFGSMSSSRQSALCPPATSDDSSHGSRQPKQMISQESLSSIENKEVQDSRVEVPKTGGDDAIAGKGINANDSSSVEVVRYRVALGPIKFSYYARGRKKR